MPLDGDDEVGMFCILLPQPLDCSIKKLETWRPYEIRNGGDGRTFDNKLMLLTLRYANQDVGTMEIVREALNPKESAWLASRRSIQKATTSFQPSGNVPIPGEEVRHELLSDKGKSRPRSPNNVSDIQLDHNNKRRRTCTADTLTEHLFETMQSAELHERCSTPSAPVVSQQPTPILLNTSQPPSALMSTPTSTATARTSLDSVSCSTTKPTAPAGSTSSTTNAPAPTTISSSDMAEEHIQIVWAFEVDREKYELPLTMAECRSFSEMLEMLRTMAQDIPYAAVLLAETKLWRMTFSLPDGTKSNKMARTGTEVAFSRIRKELGQPSFSTGNTIEIELRAIG
jgi:hypothetical protein